MRQHCGKVAYARIDINKLSNFRAFSCRDIHRMLAYSDTPYGYIVYGVLYR